MLAIVDLKKMTRLSTTKYVIPETTAIDRPIPISDTSNAAAIAAPIVIIVPLLPEKSSLD